MAKDRTRTASSPKETAERAALRFFGPSKRATAEELLRELMRRSAVLGGKARIAQLTTEERRALARKAGKASGAARRRKARS